MRSRTLAIFGLLSSLALAAVVLTGCSSKEDPKANVSDGGDVDAPPCATDAHRLEAGTCDSVLAWTAGPALAPARAQHSTFIMEKGSKAFLYAVGGTDYKKDFADAWFSPIQADGTIGAWTMTNGLPTQRKGHATVVSDTLVVVTGGKLGTAILDKTFYSFVQDDGTLARWLEGVALPGPRFGHSAAVANGRIYVMGGIEADKAVAKVYSSKVSTGGFGKWTEVTSLVSPRTHHGSFVNGNFLYVVGGFDGDPAASATPLADILRAPIMMDGSLGAWSSIAAIDVPLATHSSVIHSGYLYLLGGAENGNDVTDHVRRATIGADGAIGAWQASSPPLPRTSAYNASTPLYKSRIYSVGGTQDQTSAIGEVSIGTFQ